MSPGNPEKDEGNRAPPPQKGGPNGAREERAFRFLNKDDLPREIDAASRSGLPRVLTARGRPG